MRRALVVLLFLAWTPPADAAPIVSIEARSLVGPAPFEVTLTAVGTADSFAWDLGDGTTATGRVVTHRYETGQHTATVTASLAGESAQASAVVVAATITLSGPQAGTYGRRTVMRGQVRPALKGALIGLRAGDQVVGLAKTDAKGRFEFRPRLGHPADYVARFGSVVSNVVVPEIRPRLEVSLPRSRMIGRKLVLSARARPVNAGQLEVRIWRDGRRQRTQSSHTGTIRFRTNRPAQYVVQIVVHPEAGFARLVRTFKTNVYVPYLDLGARGASVRILEARLSHLRYALRGIDGSYGTDTYEAVLAFQKVHGLRRTGRVDPGLWRRLYRTGVPRARWARPRHHIEVDKRRQVLFEVERGRVVRVVHVSTGATGNTPLGRWRVYKKVHGWSWVLWYPMYFLRGFAIHGYPSVPAYPASHGCVRVPMWIAPKLFAANPYGQTIYVY